MDINRADVIEVLTKFCREIVDNYTLNLEKVKSIEIVDTESDTDSEVDQEEIITVYAKNLFDYEKMLIELPSDKTIKKLVDLFDIKFNFNQKQKENNYIRMKSRLNNILSKIKKMNTNIEIDEETSLSKIKEIITNKLVKLFLDGGIINQLRYSVDELRPYKFAGVILFVLLIIIGLYYLSKFIYHIYEKYNQPEEINKIFIKNIYN